MINMAVDLTLPISVVLSSLQGGADFRQRVFSGAEFEEGSSRGGAAAWCTEVRFERIVPSETLPSGFSQHD